MERGRDPSHREETHPPRALSPSPQRFEHSNQRSPNIPSNISEPSDTIPQDLPSGFPPSDNTLKVGLGGLPVEASSSNPTPAQSLNPTASPAPPDEKPASRIGLDLGGSNESATVYFDKAQPQSGPVPAGIPTSTFDEEDYADEETAQLEAVSAPAPNCEPEPPETDQPLPLPEPFDERFNSNQMRKSFIGRRRMEPRPQAISTGNSMSADNPFRALGYQTFANPRCDVPDLPCYIDGRARVLPNEETTMFAAHKRANLPLEPPAFFS